VPRCTWGGGDFSLRPLDPQDYGLGVSAYQSVGHSGGVVSVPTCRLSGWVHAVWSPSGPQGGVTACMPYPPNSSSSEADLVKWLSRVRRKPRRAELVGVGHWCQPAGQSLCSRFLSASSVVIAGRAGTPSVPIRRHMYVVRSASASPENLSGGVISAGMPAFSAWSFLSLTVTAHGAPTYPDELEVRCVWDETVPNGRYISPGDLAVIRDNHIVFGAGWIDSIQAEPGRKIRYRCPNCGSTDFKHRTRKQLRYRCATCTTQFNQPTEAEFPVQVFTANYSRTWRPADRLFPKRVLDNAYVSRSQQNAIRRLDVAQLRPILDRHLITGNLWWETYARDDERIPGGHGLGLTKTQCHLGLVSD
jgi:DNA-directed RNA polymerase subunit RPC12/RpoP